MHTAHLRLNRSINLWIIPTHIWDGRVETGDLEIGVGGRGSVPLHGDQPGRGDLVGILGESRGLTQQNHGFILFFARVNEPRVPLTGPMGMPRAIRSSSERSPGFFSFRRVSNSFPYGRVNTDRLACPARHSHLPGRRVLVPRSKGLHGW